MLKELLISNVFLIRMLDCSCVLWRGVMVLFMSIDIFIFLKGNDYVLVWVVEFVVCVGVFF